MADFRDVMHARTAADNARHDVEVLAGKLEDQGMLKEVAMLLAASAICLELRALVTQLDHSIPAPRP